MSDNDAPTCKEGDVIEQFRGKNISASQTPYMGQWMAHWMQPCKSSSSKDCQLHSDALADNILHKFEGHDSSELDRLKSKEFKFVRVDMNQRYSFVDKGKSNLAAEDDPSSYDIRSGEPCVDREKFKIKENFSMRRNVEPINDGRTFCKKLSAQQLTESSIKWKKIGSYCCHSLDVSESNFEHLPMLDINREIETMLASKEKSAYGAVSVKMVKENLSLCESIGTSSLVELAPGSCLAARKITDDAEKMMTTYEGFLPDSAVGMDGASSPVIHGCKYQKENMIACIFSSGLTNVDPHNKLTCVQHNLCSCSSSSKSRTTETKGKIYSISKGFRNSWTSLKGGSNHVLSESSPTDFLYSFSTEGHGSEVKADSSSWLLLDQRRLGKPDGSDINHLPCQMPKCSIHDMSLTESCQNLKSVEIGERFHKFSSTVKYLLVTDKMGKDQCLRERTMGDSPFTQVNGNTLSKTVTIPTELSCGKKEKSAVRLENFVSDEDRDDRNDSGVHLMGEHNEFSTKVDTISTHPLHGSSSLPGESISSPQKATAYSNLRNSKTTSASSAREVSIRNAEIGMAKREEHLASIDEVTHASHTEASVSSTESLAADHIVKVPDVSSSSLLADHTSGSETCSRWIKRLRGNHSESLSLCTKRFKKGEDSIEIQQSSSRIQNHNPLSSGSLGFMKEHDNSENVLPCGDSDESLQLWIRRWCRNDHEVSQTLSTPSVPLALQPEKLGVPHEKFEGKMSASIGAMALMGRAMNKYTPCRFRREEASLVWNTEE
ncbi:uncharacterized protein LOC110104909 [Dendrobium catenatum]|uniref:F-box protein n=1 Tax=Dendrobium catenatum TaxID=906689 RepID=A0A2I0VIT2_9ASPA|nr:uncharacterized protein LOC110104909 [Dendrobium catenatum]XP_028557197.1 uncharacterized protein LOC110104909 [Dendrobium catenatum]PKU63319.1 F-box protein [Dendrobium catenatum]